MRMLLTLPLAALLIGCGGAHNDKAIKAATVTIRDFKYGPALHVATGTAVTWVNRDSAPHTVTGPGLKLGTLAKGQRRSFTFSKAGTYSYVCLFHPFMHGTVVVG